MGFGDSDKSTWNLGIDMSCANLNELFSNYEGDIMKQIGEGFKPAGMGVTFDLGVTYKPIKNLQISAAVTDLGFIRWHRHAQASLSVDTAYFGTDNIALDSIGANIGNVLDGFKDALHISSIKTPQPRQSMLTANLNVGVDANFWKNRIGVGVYSELFIFPSV